MIPRLNEIYETYKDKGLIVVGVSDETEDKLANYVDAHSPKYPIVRAPGALNKYGGKYFPSVFTIAPDGKILSVPDERIPPESLIKKALESVVTLADLPDDARFSALRSAYKKRHFAKVAEWFDNAAQSKEFDDKLKAVIANQHERFKERAKSMLDEVTSLGNGPDYYAAQARLLEIRKDWKGMPAEKAAEAMLKRFSKDRKIKSEISALKRLARVQKRYDPASTVQRRKLKKALHEFAKRHEGTYAAQKAAKLEKSLVEKK